MGGENRVVGFNDGCGNLGGWVHSETEFRFFTVVYGKSFKKEGAQTGSGTTTDGMEHQKSLETRAVIGQFSDSVQTEVDDFFTDCVMSTGEIVSGVFLSGNQLFWMEKLSVGSGSYFIDNCRLQIQEYGSGNVFTSSRLGEESIEGIITTSDRFV